MPHEAAEHDVFISYNRQDSAAVESVARALRARGLSVYLDRWYLAPGQPWRPALEGALRSCRSVAVFIGPHEMGEWQKREFYVADDRHHSDPRVPVIPVLLPGASDPPLGFLRGYSWVDLRENGADLEALIAGIQGRSPGPDDRVERGICPYRGLRYFREEDADFFFGREAFAERLIEALERRHLVAVAGASGSGKSSVVRAGLVPRLRRGTHERVWGITTVFPRERPLHSLAAALLPRLEPEMSRVDRLVEVNKLADHFSDGSVQLRDVIARVLERQPGTDSFLVVVDQWEELYTLCRDDAGRKRFIDTVLDATDEGPLTVVITLRGDFYGEALSYRPLADRLQDSVLNLGPMTRPEMERAVVEPARKVGLAFEDGLIDRILDAVEEQPGSLPLLEFVLTELWEHQRGRLLVNRAYDEMGELQGAIARRADDIYESASPEEQELLHRVFKELVRPGDLSADTRRRATFAEIGERARPIIQRMADARLLVTGHDRATGEDTVEVAHEALIRHWERLRRWLESDRDFLVWRDRLRQTSDLWRQLNRDRGGLLRGSALANARHWRAERAADLSAKDLEFIDESARAELRWRWRRRLGIAAVSVALIALPLMVWRFIENRLAEREVRAVGLLNEANRLFDTNPLLGALLITELPSDFEPPGGLVTARRFLDDVILPSAELRHDERINFASFSPDGSQVVTGSDDGRVRLWPSSGRGVPIVLTHTSAVRRATFDATGGRLVTALADGSAWIWSLDDQRSTTLSGGGGGLRAAAFSPEGSLVAAASEGHRVRLWELDSAGGPRDLVGHGGAVVDVAFSPDGSRLVSASLDGTARIWDLSGASAPLVLSQDEVVLGASFSPDGSRVLTRSYDGVRIWDSENGRLIAQPAAGSEAWGAEYSPDGSHVIVASGNGEATLWTAARPDTAVTFDVGEGRLNDAAFSPDGSRIALAGQDGTAWLLCPLDSCPPRALRGHSDAIHSVEFSRDGTLLLTRSADNTVRVWRVSQASEPVTLQARSARILSAAADPDISSVLGGLSDGRVLTWTSDPTEKVVLAGGSEPAEPESFPADAGSIIDVNFSPDGSRAVTASADGVVKVWNAASWALEDSLTGHGDKVAKTAFSPDGSLLLTASADGTARIWKPGTGASPIILRGHRATVSGASFSEDGSRVLTHSRDGTARVWNVADPAETVVLPVESPVLSSSFGARGATVVTASEDTSVRLWRLDDPGSPVPLQYDHLVGIAVYSRDGSRLATGAADGTVRVWEGSGRNEPLILPGHAGKVTALAFSGDATRLLTASTDSTARLWRVDGKGEPVVLRGHEGPVFQAFLAADGSRAATVTAGTIRIWRLGWPQLLRQLRSETSACLRPADRQRYLRETEAEAREAYALCEHEEGRARPASPTPSSSPKPQEIAG